MADKLILKIDATLTEQLRVRAAAEGQSVEVFTLGVLRRAVEQPGLEENETPWNGTAANTVDDGFDEDSEAYADYIDRFCDEAERAGGVPWEQVQARLRNFGQPR
jgi:plasmid stability protein